MERAREGVAGLLINVLHDTVMNFECISYRILWVKLVCVVVGYFPNEGDGQEMERS